LLLVPVVLFGWYMFTELSAEASGGEPQAVCGLIIDRSMTADDGPLRAEFADAVDKTISGCAALEAYLSVYVIDPTGNEVRVGDYPLYPERARTERIRESSLEERLEQVRADVPGLLDEVSDEAGGGSNILRAVHSGGLRINDTARVRGIDKRHLVVLTDGLQSAPAVSVAALNEQGAPLEPLLEAARTSGYFPELNGVVVTMIGVGAGVDAEGRTLPGWFRGEVEDLWRTIISEAGGSHCVRAGTPSTLPGEAC
jgi:hypothetical protein